MKKWFCILITILCFISCKTMPKNPENNLYIMIYDYENNSVKDVSIFEDDKEIGTTDIYGRFILSKKNTPLNLTLKKNGYETLTTTITKNDKNVLYIKLGSGYYYATQSEKLVDQGKFDEALIYIEKALSCEKRKDYEYLKEVIQKKVAK